MKNVAKVKAICYNNSNPSNTIMSLRKDVVETCKISFQVLQKVWFKSGCYLIFVLILITWQ